MRIVKVGVTAYGFVDSIKGNIPIFTNDQTIEITDIKWRPENWTGFIEYFEGRPDDMTPLELWEFGATSMLKALMELKEEK